MNNHTNDKKKTNEKLIKQRYLRYEGCDDPVELHPLEMARADDVRRQCIPRSRGRAKHEQPACVRVRANARANARSLALARARHGAGKTSLQCRTAGRSESMRTETTFIEVGERRVTATPSAWTDRYDQLRLPAFSSLIGMFTKHQRRES